MEFSLVHLPPTTLSEVLSAGKGEGICAVCCRKVSCSSSYSHSHYRWEDDFELLVFLPPPHEF